MKNMGFEILEIRIRKNGLLLREMHAHGMEQRKVNAIGKIRILNPKSETISNDQN